MADAILPPELKGKFTCKESSAGLEIIDESDSLIAHVTAFLDAEPYPIENYFIEIMRSTCPGDLKCGPVRLKDDFTLGWLFPLGTLNSDSESVSNLDRWGKSYAAIASRSLLFSEVGSFHISKELDGALLGKKVDLTEIFSQNLAVVVLWKKEVSKQNLEKDEIVLMLQKYGLQSIHQESNAAQGEAIQVDSNFNIERIAPDLRGDVKELSNLMTVAESQQSPLARFLTTYQVIERIISLIFESRISQLLKEVGSSGDPWKLREELSSIASEKKRLGYLFSHVNKGSEFGAASKALGQSCAELLDRIGTDRVGRETPRSWHERLYLVRNIVVHRQTLINSGCYEQMHEICYELRALCFVLLAAFSLNIISQQPSGS